MFIIGAGLAGLLAGNLFQRAEIIEAGPEDQLSHRAVLRFRSSRIGDATGIDFRRVVVHKGIWFEEGFCQPNIRLANWYSQKVIGELAERSLWKIETVERFIAPTDIVPRLAERCRGRIAWGTKVEQSTISFGRTHVVSTMPMPKLVDVIGPHSIPTPAFVHAPITVRRWKVPGADVFQTIYFPDPETRLYRASITGDLLIAEYAGDEASVSDNEELLCRAFGLSRRPMLLDSTKQRYGKIAAVDDAWRRQFILHATLKHQVYSLGRFATWRNLLLDDVLDDIAVIKKLITNGAYMAARSM